MSWHFTAEGPRDQVVEKLERNVDLPQCVKEGLAKTLRAFPNKHYYVATQGHRDDQHGDLSFTVMQTRG